MIYKSLFYTEKPKVHLEISIQSQPLIYGNTIILEADIDSCPTYETIQWQKNNCILESDGIKFVKDHSNKQNPKLSIHNADFDDSGTYFIIATNVLGTADDQAEVLIGGK